VKGGETFPFSVLGKGSSFFSAGGEKRINLLIIIYFMSVGKGKKEKLHLVLGGYLLFLKNKVYFESSLSSRRGGKEGNTPLSLRKPGFYPSDGEGGRGVLGSERLSLLRQGGGKGGKTTSLLPGEPYGS